MEYTKWNTVFGTATVTVLWGTLVCFLDSGVQAAVDRLGRRVPDNIYMDPCKARGFMGDIALSDEDVDSMEAATREKTKGTRKSFLLETQVEDFGIDSSPVERESLNNYNHKQQLITNKNRLKKMVKETKAEIRTRCPLETKEQCRQHKSMLRAELQKNRDKWRNISLKLKHLQRLEREAATLITDKMTDGGGGVGEAWGEEAKRNYDTKSLKSRKEFKKTITNKQHRLSRTRRAATALKKKLWDFGVVPFVIDGNGNFSGRDKALFRMAMKHWEKHTCITFKEKEPEDQNYIVFTVKPCGCCSFVGKEGKGPQAISIGKHCAKFGIVVHELGHVIGFWHEHSRPDRDEHVQIISKNIKAGRERNFVTLKPGAINSLGETYDYDSIMHYAKNTYARHQYLDTILTRRQPGAVVRPEIGQRVKLSPGDIRQANKLYKCPSCGRTLQEPSGVFSHTPTPGEPESCQWRISATHGEKIVINISMLNIPTSNNCETDYLEVRDGHYIKSPLLGRFCGDNLPETLTSSGRRLWIEYKTRNGKGRGFTANYQAECGGVYTIQGEGTLASPNYPDSYPPDKACAWRISTEEGFTVGLKLQSLEIEIHVDCMYDYLEVRDGPDESSPLIGNYCGYKIPEDIQSTGKDLYVKFVSDGSVQKAGFNAVFVKEFDECSGSDHGCDHVCVNTIGSYKCDCRPGYELRSDGKTCENVCGGHVDDVNGTITSPSHPGLYPPNKNCVWQIVAPAEHTVIVTFTHFDIEGHNQDCEQDSVRVSSIIGHHSELHGVFCGDSIPDPVTSQGNVLRIEFDSDYSTQRTGFKATFAIDKDECSVNNGGCQHVCQNTVGSYHCACHNGFTLHDDLHGCKEGGCQFDIKKHYGMINSPNFPDNYPSRKDCVWHFTTVPGHRIRLRFKTFELEPYQNCTYDHVAVFDGDNENNDKRLGKFCGSGLPYPVVSTGNKMLMTFFSDVSVQEKGFEAEHDTVCGAHLFASDTAQGLVSHARYGDHNYDNRADCEWKIQAKEGHTIQLRFNAFDLEGDLKSACRYDMVQVYDGLKTTDDLLGTYCGTKVPEPVQSSSEYLLIRFTSDGSNKWKGFSATYQQATTSRAG